MIVATERTHPALVAAAALAAVTASVAALAATNIVPAERPRAFVGAIAAVGRR
jgi:hypothetical protein